MLPPGDLTRRPRSRSTASSSPTPAAVSDQDHPKLSTPANRSASRRHAIRRIAPGAPHTLRGRGTRKEPLITTVCVLRACELDHCAQRRALRSELFQEGINLKNSAKLSLLPETSCLVRTRRLESGNLAASGQAYARLSSLLRVFDRAILPRPPPCARAPSALRREQPAAAAKNPRNHSRYA